MSDIRRIILDSGPVENVVAVPEEVYQLQEGQLDELNKVLTRLLEQDYYSPEYQAWEPLAQTYLSSGNNPNMMTQYGKKLVSKIEEFQPPRNVWTPTMESLLAANRSRSSEMLPGVCWQELKAFYDMVPKYIDYQKSIRGFMFSSMNYNESMQALLKKQVGESFSKDLPWAVYMYRHTMIESNPQAAYFKQEIDTQLREWVREFEKYFDMVMRFIGKQTAVYEWYTPKVKSLISNAWLTGTNTTSTRSVVSSADVFSMPVWLSEQVTQYLNTLPTVLTTPVTPVYILNALEYTLSSDADSGDRNSIYTFCIPKSYLKKYFEILGDFYWDMKNGALVTAMRNRVAAIYTEKRYLSDEAKTPEEYDAELLERGFPLDLITGGEESDEQT